MLSREIITGIVLSTLIFLAASFIPVIGSGVIIFTPLPILYYDLKLGRIGAIIVVTLSALLVFLSLRMVHAEWNLLIFIAMGLVGMILASLFKRGASIEISIIGPVAALWVLVFMFIVYQGYTTGQTPWHLVENYVSKSIQENIRFYELQGFSPDMLNLIKNDVPRITNYFTGIFPAFTLMMATFVVLMNVLAGRLILQMRNLPCPDFGDLTCWKAPERLVWLLIAAGGSVLVPGTWVKLAGMNVLMVCLFLYMLQGFAIIAYVFKRKNVPWFLRFTFYFLIFVQQYFILIISALGLFDLWADFRKYVRMKDTTA